ncbi:hypothetical protein ABIA96_007174 [Bradyrhizobium sp. LB11.1]|jgi:hypothetical protein
MSNRTEIVLIALLCLLSALNAVALVLNLLQPSRAAVGGMSYQGLLRDPISRELSRRSRSSAASTSTSPS